MQDRTAHVVATCYLESVDSAKGEHAFALAKALIEAKGQRQLKASQSRAQLPKPSGGPGGTGTHNSKSAYDCGMNAISSDTLLTTRIGTFVSTLARRW